MQRNAKAKDLDALRKTMQLKNPPPPTTASDTLYDLPGSQHKISMLR